MLSRVGVGFVVAALALSVQAQSWAWDDGTTPYVQSPMEVVERMLWLAQPRPGEYLIDLEIGRASCRERV